MSCLCIHNHSHVILLVAKGNNTVNTPYLLVQHGLDLLQRQILVTLSLQVQKASAAQNFQTRRSCFLLHCSGQRWLMQDEWERVLPISCQFCFRFGQARQLHGFIKRTVDQTGDTARIVRQK